MVILFDGVCNLCNGFVQFVIKQDRRMLFKFASLQSVYGQGALKHFNLDGKEFDTVLLYDVKKIYTRTDAALKIFNSLGGIWKVFGLCRAFPRPFRNFFYNSIAKRRYKLFGIRATCMAPAPELKERFVDEMRFA